MLNSFPKFFPQHHHLFPLPKKKTLRYKAETHTFLIAQVRSASEDSSSEHVAKLNNSASEIKGEGSVEETLNLWLLRVGVDVATENGGGND